MKIYTFNGHKFNCLEFLPGEKNIFLLYELDVKLDGNYVLSFKKKNKKILFIENVMQKSYEVNHSVIKTSVDVHDSNVKKKQYLFIYTK